jgi:hypothetical protein
MVVDFAPWPFFQNSLPNMLWGTTACSNGMPMTPPSPESSSSDSDSDSDISSSAATSSGPIFADSDDECTSDDCGADRRSNQSTINGKDNDDSGEVQSMKQPHWWVIASFYPNSNSNTANINNQRHNTRRGTMQVHHGIHRFYVRPRGGG